MCTVTLKRQVCQDFFKSEKYSVLLISSWLVALGILAPVFLLGQVFASTVHLLTALLSLSQGGLGHKSDCVQMRS